MLPDLHIRHTLEANIGLFCPQNQRNRWNYCAEVEGALALGLTELGGLPAGMIGSKVGGGLTTGEVLGLFDGFVFTTAGVVAGGGDEGG